MALPKFQIFISSTYEDLKDERSDLVMACLEMGHIPVGMEMFSAGNADQWKVIARTIEQCDYYVVLLAQRYGSTIDAEGGISYTEKEYDYAVSKGVPVAGFILDRGANWPMNKVETDPTKRERLEKFKAKVGSKMVRFWSDRKELKGTVAISLSKMFVDDPRPGWVPASQAASAQVTEELARLSKENEDIRIRLRLAAQKTSPDQMFESLVLTLSKIPTDLYSEDRTKAERGTASLLELFETSGDAFSHTRTLGEFDIDQSIEPISQSLWHLESLELLDSPDRRGSSSRDTRFCLSPKGRDLLRFIARRRLLDEANASIDTIAVSDQRPPTPPSPAPSPSPPRR